MLELSKWQLLVLFQHELLLFAGIFFLLGALDDFGVDLCGIWLRLTGRAKAETVDSESLASEPLDGPTAIFIPAWQESEVIGYTIAHALSAWPQAELLIYVGCYRNDPETIQVVMAAAPGDPLLRLVIHDRAGPGTKADGKLHVLRSVHSFDLGEVSGGAAAWGGAQKDAERIDLGPSVRFDLSIGEAPARLSVDYRQRVAGEAEPPSGVVVTLSTRF